MRIVLLGQAAFGDRVLEALLAQGEHVVGVFCPPDAPGKANPLRQRAESQGLPVYQPRRMRAPEAFEAYQALRPDLNVMAFVTEIIPERILSYPPCGTIQYHPSLLPKHRGGSAINWAVINGEAKTGLTIFWPDCGIDTGPILLQKEVAICPDDTTGSLYFDKLFPLGVQAIVEAVQLVKDGKAPRIPQDETQASYEPLCTEARTVIDWGRPVEQVYNLIRGANPQPGAVTIWRGRRLKLFDCERLSAPASARPGEVISIGAEGFGVAAAGGAILIKRVQPEGEAKVKAPVFVAAGNLRAGDRLGAET
jgi:methionyl-tRNA formyltransferase